MQYQPGILQAEEYYHIYNHANGFENIFNDDENYRFFLQQWNKYIYPVADTFCYCLMPNHFHFLVKIKSKEVVFENLEKVNEKRVKKIKLLKEINNSANEDRTNVEESNTLQKLVSKQFSNLFSSYTQSFNKINRRRGSLFISSFKNKRIDNEEYLLNLIYYIHRNPLHHGFCDDFREWKHSSYHSLLTGTSLFLNHSIVEKVFQDIRNFEASHLIKLNSNEEYYLE